MGAFVQVGWIGLMISTCLLQTIGFLSPHWACKIDKTNPTPSPYRPGPPYPPYPTGTTYQTQTNQTTTPYQVVKTPTSQTPYQTLYSTVNPDNNTTNKYCEIQGLYYPSGMLDKDMFGLCLTCLLGSYLTTAYIVYKFQQYLKGNQLDFILEDPWERIASVLFLIFQFLAGVANLLGLLRFDVLGWSAIIFFTFGFPVFVVVATIVAVTVACLCCQALSKDDD